MPPIFEEGSHEGHELDEILGKPVWVDEQALSDFTNDEEYSVLAFELYKESGKILALCSHSFIGYESGDKVLGRDQAVCAGLLVRIAKFMTAVMQLVSSKPNSADVVFALNRCIVESAVNMRFLAVRHEKRFYDQFVDSALGRRENSTI